MSVRRTLIVGASAAGVTAAESLRSQGYAGSNEVIGAERHHAYDRPPLSKQLLSGEWEGTRLQLRPDAHLASLDVHERLGSPAVDLDPIGRQVTTADGARTGYDALVIATGVRPRRLAGTEGTRGVHVLRTLEDAEALRAEVDVGKRVVVIGGGFLGAEIASVLQASVGEVVLLTAGENLLERVIGRPVGAELMALHRSMGITVIPAPLSRVRSLVTDTVRVSGVVLGDGSVLETGLVVIAIGSEPAVDWLRMSGLDLSDGVGCASDCSAAPGIYAAGDVARWWNPLFTTSMRVEHRTNAVDQAIHVAERIVRGDDVDYAPVPYFWSDQFGLRLQAHGWLKEHDECVVVEGSVSDRRLVALYRRGGALTGVLAMGAAKALRTWRSRITEGITWRDALDAAP